MSDDEMFLNLGEYAHGPLIGHQVPCEHLLFEARLSERDFPWLAEHRVHHASIMPAAGYIELLLQAFEGVPLHVETLEFLQPCPIPRTPVRLHTELFPVANAPDEFTFTISSRSYETEAHSELHSRGKVRLVSSDHPVNVPLRLADIDTTPFAPYYFVGESDFYERVDASLGETFQYGPYFQNIQRVLSDNSTGDYLFDVEMDEQLWTTGRAEGYVANPALLDGGLQIFPLSSAARDGHLRPSAARPRCDISASADRTASYLPREERPRLGGCERTGAVHRAARRAIRGQHPFLRRRYGRPRLVH